MSETETPKKDKKNEEDSKNRQALTTTVGSATEV
jgi:hypothetical protein